MFKHALKFLFLVHFEKSGMHKKAAPQRALFFPQNNDNDKKYSNNHFSLASFFSAERPVRPVHVSRVRKQTKCEGTESRTFIYPSSLISFPPPFFFRIFSPAILSEI